jgi:hypothetical protein
MLYQKGHVIPCLCSFTEEKSYVLNRDYCVFGLCPLSGILKNITFRKLYLFSSSGVEVEGSYFIDFVRNSYPHSLTALSNGHNRLDVSHRSPEEGNRSSFRNVMFFSDLHNSE